VVPELKLEEVRFRVYRGETMRATGDAAIGTLRRDSTELTARRLSTVLYEAGSPPAHVTAAEGHGFLNSRRFQASGGVTMARGVDVARTPSARFEPTPGKPGTVRGDEPIVVQGPAYRLEGPRFTLDPSTGDIEIPGGARLVAGVPSAR
jgi:lipopolysaccharide export system protein LptC